MRNRITQHLAAIEPDQSLAGRACYRLVKYKPHEVCPDWTPSHLLDTWRRLKIDDALVSCLCFSGLLPALLSARRWNHLSQFTGTAQSLWTGVAWVEAGLPEVTERFARLVTPLLYSALPTVAPPDWQPSCPLLAPDWEWAEESTRLRRFKTLDSAAVYVAKKNRRFATRKPGLFGRTWWIALAIEYGEKSALSTIDFSGERGLAYTAKSERCHIVTRDWPLSDAALAEIGGGAW